jgi:hypothetical protein
MRRPLCAFWREACAWRPTTKGRAGPRGRGEGARFLDLFGCASAVGRNAAAHYTWAAPSGIAERLVQERCSQRQERLCCAERLHRRKQTAEACVHASAA